MGKNDAPADETFEPDDGKEFESDNGKEFQLKGQSKDSQRSVGALWVHEGRSGEYWSGVVMGKRVMVFRNGRKTGDNSPDLRVLLARQDQTPF